MLVSMSELSVDLRPTTESDRTYIARLNFLTDVFGDESATPSAHFVDAYHLYVENWRPTGGGFIAVDSLGIPCGGIWLIYGTEEEHGYGHVEEGIPELAIAVENRNQGQGLGTRLLTAAIDQVRESGAPGISLCVDDDNPGAHKLYLRMGFEEVAYDSEHGYHGLVQRF